MIMEIGLIVVRAVTISNIKKAVEEVMKIGYFDSLLPIE